MTLQEGVLAGTSHRLLQTLLLVAPRNYVTVVINVENLLVNRRHRRAFRRVHFRMTVSDSRPVDGNDHRRFVDQRCAR